MNKSQEQVEFLQKAYDDYLEYLVEQFSLGCNMSRSVWELQSKPSDIPAELPDRFH